MTVLKRVSNNKARDYVNGFKEFQGSNTTGKWLNREDTNFIYVVYSYGAHFPMYIYDKKQNKWIGNKDKYSRSTTRHQSLLRPSNEVEVWYNTNDMKEVIYYGGLVEHTINKAQH